MRPQVTAEIPVMLIRRQSTAGSQRIITSCNDNLLMVDAKP